MSIGQHLLLKNSSEVEIIPLQTRIVHFYHWNENLL